MYGNVSALKVDAQTTLCRCHKGHCCLNSFDTTLYTKLSILGYSVLLLIKRWQCTQHHAILAYNWLSKRRSRDSTVSLHVFAYIACNSLDNLHLCNDYYTLYMYAN